MSGMAGEGRGGLRAGYAAVEISPPAGTDMTGFIARTGPSEGVLDPLEARALVFQDARGSRAALVTCDLIGIGKHLVARVRQAIEAATGIPGGAVMFNCSHTHAGPETGVLTTIGIPVPEYLVELERKLAEVVIAAARALRPATLRAATGEVPEGLAVNRVYRRQGNGDRYDHQLTVVRLDSDDGQPLATIVSFACHAVALGHEERHSSADYVAALRGVLEAAGSGPVLYVNGCGGDVNPAAMDNRGRPAAEQLGRGLAEVALPLWLNASAAPPNPAAEAVAAAQEWVTLPYFDMRTAKQAAVLLAAGRERLSQSAPGSPQYRGTLITDVEYPLRLLRLYYGNETVPQVEAEVQALRVGPIALVALPGEIFSSFGLAIREASPFGAAATLMAGWSNDNVGYVPDREAYGVATYEADTAARYYGHPAPWAPEAGDALQAAAFRLLEQVSG